jgi:hypothetical protein
MGSGGSSSFAGLAVEYACLGWIARLGEESTDRSMTDHVLFTPFPYKQATTEDLYAFSLFPLPPPSSVVVTPQKTFE